MSEDWVIYENQFTYLSVNHKRCYTTDLYKVDCWDALILSSDLLGMDSVELDLYT